MKERENRKAMPYVAVPTFMTALQRKPSFGRLALELLILSGVCSQEVRLSESHVRRLEAMRRVTHSVEREADGNWIIAPDHLDKIEQLEARQLRDRPVTVETLSAVPLDKLPGAEAATWLDRELVADAPAPLRDAGFGSEVRAAQAMRRQWLVAEQLAEERDGRTVYRRDMLAALQRRELLRAAGQLLNEVGKPFVEAKPNEQIQGRLLRAVDLTSGRYALVERSRDFVLVPWRPVMELHIGKAMSSLVREGGISWTFGRSAAVRASHELMK